VHVPRLIILDEPLTGLDAAVARQVKDLLVARVKLGRTVILTTHILEVAERLADPVAAKQMVAWVSDEPMIYDKLTPLEYLEFVAGLWGVDPAVSELSAHHLLASLGLEPHLGERCEGFSKGMRQKVALAGALVHDPRLIILDEPLTGLDAVSARHVKGLLGDRVRAGCTVIMTTHILEVAERMADRIGVIASGRLVAEGTLTELRQQNGHMDTSLEDLFITLVNPEAAAA
jgi:ABC-2 type transport system ATP-binding protein